mgnify:FL=1
MENSIGEIDLNMKKSLKDIYSKIFCRIEEQYIIVFLCGGASTKSKKSLRDKMRLLLENEKKRYSRQLPIKVFYPEDLLIDVLNKTKDADLLSYEQFLANNSHIISIICESAGSLVELGAFTNNEYTVNKVIAAVDKKRVKDKSFIMLGPIKYLKKKNKLNVVEYSSDEKEFARVLLKNIREKHAKDNNDKKIRLNTIVGMHYFIQLLLYYFKQINSKKLVDMIQMVAQDENIEMKEFNVLFNAALKLLFYDKQIIKMTDQRYAVYELTKKGYHSIEGMIARCTSRETCDMIRIEIMYCDFYKSPHS